MTFRELPLLGQAPRERSDAARNREALLAAAAELVREHGVGHVTMDAVAERAHVGKGTVFRRFDSRKGLMAALLDRSETEWQAAVMSGPPPLGPGAPPRERLLAFGPSRARLMLTHEDLFEAAGSAAVRNYAAWSFAATHVRYLLGELRVQGDVALLATYLLAPLELPILRQQVEIEGRSFDSLMAGWADLVDRVVATPRDGAGRR